ncbi:hypothetical protein RF55_13438 [Lasius niger]|uniref:Uncharacterized protein n=1 Tax=Lasius niger TaxID=67767 RepID=A0A0J7KAP7_LASNI|nr:hypothetical protein RF55_13438 [Lasius niger]
MKAWIYERPKSDLAAFAANHGLDASGTIDDIRRRLRTYLEAHPEITADAELTTAADPSTETFADARDAPRTPVTFTVPEFRSTTVTYGEDTKSINQMRKWGCQLDGRDPIAFLERIEELKIAYGLSDQQMLKGLPELMRGDALLWLRNNREN